METGTPASFGKLERTTSINAFQWLAVPPGGCDAGLRLRSDIDQLNGRFRCFHLAEEWVEFRSCSRSSPRRTQSNDAALSFACISPLDAARKRSGRQLPPKVNQELRRIPVGSLNFPLGNLVPKAVLMLENPLQRPASVSQESFPFQEVDPAMFYTVILPWKRERICADCHRAAIIRRPVIALWGSTRSALIFPPRTVPATVVCRGA